MKLFYLIFSLASSILAVGLPTNIPTVPVTYDQTYDVPTKSLGIVACSNGANGLLTKGCTTFESLPNFPFIGGTSTVIGWNSTNCGSCWALTYNGQMVRILAVDTAGSGFNIGLQAMNKLTGGRAVELGKVTATVVRLTGESCGM